MIVWRQAARPNAAQNPAYKLIRHIFNNIRAVLLKLCHNSDIGIRFIFAFAAFNG